MRAVLLLAALLLPAACASAARVGTLTRYEGIYRYGFEVESFQPCGRSERWWVARSDDLRARVPEGERMEGEVFVVVRGRVGPEGGFGHLGGYARMIEVAEVLEVRPTSRNACGVRSALRLGQPDAPRGVP